MLKTKISDSQFLLVLATMITIVVNAASELLPLHGKTAAEISDAIPSYFTPAGFTFAIWGVIYISWLGFVWYRLRIKPDSNQLLHKLDLLFLLSCVVNSAWVLLWHLEYVHICAALTVALAVILGIGYFSIWKSVSTTDKNFFRYVSVMFSIYFAWSIVAMFANIFAALYVESWTGLGLGFFYQTWTGLVLMAIGIFTAFLLLTRRDIVFAAVIVWSIVGLYVKFSTEPGIAYTSVLVLTMIIALIVLNIFRWWRLRLQK